MMVWNLWRLVWWQSVPSRWVWGIRYNTWWTWRIHPRVRTTWPEWRDAAPYALELMA